jgi:hypothetical protein
MCVHICSVKYITETVLFKHLDVEMMNKAEHIKPVQLHYKQSRSLISAKLTPLHPILHI